MICSSTPVTSEPRRFRSPRTTCASASAHWSRTRTWRATSSESELEGQAAHTPGVLVLALPERSGRAAEHDEPASLRDVELEPYLGEGGRGHRVVRRPLVRVT